MKYQCIAAENHSKLNNGCYNSERKPKPIENEAEFLRDLLPIAGKNKPRTK